MKKHLIFIALLFSTLAFFHTCQTPDLGRINPHDIPQISIHELRTNIDLYNNKEVILEGIVTKSFCIWDRGFYELRDGDAKILIFATGNITPKRGCKPNVLIFVKVLSRTNDNTKITGVEIERKKI